MGMLFAGYGLFAFLDWQRRPEPQHRLFRALHRVCIPLLVGVSVFLYGQDQRAAGALLALLAMAMTIRRF